MSEPIEIVQLRKMLADFRETGQVEDISKPTKAFDGLLSREQQKAMAARVAELERARKTYYRKSGVRHEGNRKSHFYEQSKQRAEQLLGEWRASGGPECKTCEQHLAVYIAALEALIYFSQKVPKGERDAYTKHPDFSTMKLPRTVEEAISWMPFYDEGKGRAEYEACKNPSKIAAIEALEQLIAERLKSTAE